MDGASDEFKAGFEKAEAEWKQPDETDTGVSALTVLLSAMLDADAHTD
jgi:hypothetical protein